MPEERVRCEACRLWAEAAGLGVGEKPVLRQEGPAGLSGLADFPTALGEPPLETFKCRDHVTLN